MILECFALTCFACALMISLDVTATAARRNLHPSSSLRTLLLSALPVLIVSCGVLLWFLIKPKQAPMDLKISTILLYGACCIGYLEGRSLLSRGFSMRILSDLSEQGAISYEQLKNRYGSGMGLEGLIKKRIQTLIELRLVKINGSQVALKKPLGPPLATIGAGIRNLLCLVDAG